MPILHQNFSATFSLRTGTSHPSEITWRYLFQITHLPSLCLSHKTCEQTDITKVTFHVAKTHYKGGLREMNGSTIDKESLRYLDNPFWSLCSVLSAFLSVQWVSLHAYFLWASYFSLPLDDNYHHYDNVLRTNFMVCRFSRVAEPFRIKNF